MSRVCALFAASLLTCLFSAGCGDSGPELGRVSGQVTMDGQPLPDALVTFVPVEGGRSATGRTDADGRYELIFSDRKGALTGAHKVTVTTLKTTVSTGSSEDLTEEEYLQQAVGGRDPRQYEEAARTVTEPIPARYNTQSELVYEVTSGRNRINLELTSS